jgi:hypothetical protein
VRDDARAAVRPPVRGRSHLQLVAPRRSAVRSVWSRRPMDRGGSANGTALVRSRPPCADSSGPRVLHSHAAVRKEKHDQACPGASLHCRECERP